jgi:serine protease Do
MLARSILLLSCLLGAVCVHAQQDFLDLQRRVIEVYRSQSSSVVRIKAQREELNPTESEPRLRLTIGSGFFVSKDGHVLTNASLVYQMDKVHVEYQKGLEVVAKVAGMDLISNIALLKLDQFPATATFVRLDDSPQMPEVGLLAVAITCPLQFAPSPSLGLITGHENSIGRRPFPTPILRTSIPALPGDSGSPLFGLDGRFLGINVASIKEIHATCVFPARATKRIMDDLLLSGKTGYGTISLKVKEEKQPGVVRGQRLIVSTVVTGGPADKAGLRKGDWIQGSTHGPVHTLGDLQTALFYTRPGQLLKLTVEREGQSREFSVPVEAREPRSSRPTPRAPSPAPTPIPNN